MLVIVPGQPAGPSAVASGAGAEEVERRVAPSARRPRPGPGEPSARSSPPNRSDLATGRPGYEVAGVRVIAIRLGELVEGAVLHEQALADGPGYFRGNPFDADALGGRGRPWRPAPVPARPPAARIYRPVRICWLSRSATRWLRMQT